MPDRFCSLVLAVGIALLATVAFVPAASADPTEVTTTVDEFDDPGPGMGCSLREAIQAANTNRAFGGCPLGDDAYGNAIGVPPGTYNLTIPGPNPTNAAGDLNVIDNYLGIYATSVYDVNAPVGPTTVRAASSDRVLSTNTTTFIVGIRITGGSTSGSGGGISSTGYLGLTDVTVDGNSASGIGGGVFIGDPGNLDTFNTTISNNSARGAGGGIGYLSNYTVQPSRIYTSTIVSNTGDSDGNGDGGGGGISTGGSIHAEISNTILSGNGVKVFSGTVAEDCTGALFSGGSNLVGTDSNCTYPGASTNAGNLTGAGIGGASVIAHNTAALADNGGHVPTRLPTRSSPAINRGGAATDCGNGGTDARGVGRPQEGVCDMGAVEALPAVSSQAVSTQADELDSAFDGSCSLREAVTSANNNQATGGCQAGSTGIDTIQLTPGTYTLTRPGVDDTNALGDLDVSSGNSLLLTTTGTAQTTINGNGGVTGDRVLHVLPGPAAGGRIISGLNIQNGRPAGDGGGIESQGDLSLRRVTVSGNVAGGNGGGVHYTNAATGNVLNSTIYGNRANGDGGGMFSVATGAPSLNNVTVTENIAGADGDGGNGGGLAWIPGGPLVNSIVAGNADFSGADAPDCLGSLTTQGFNLIGQAESCTFAPASSDHVGTSAAPLSSGLGALADNGGTTLTLAPLFGSLALNFGNSLTPGSGGASCQATDQRGIARPLAGRCDIGAVEFDPAAVRQLTVAKNGSGSGTVTGTGISCGADCTESVADATAVVLSAAPGAGSVFAGWIGCDSSTGSSCTQTLGANETVTATFNLVPVVTPPPILTTPETPTTPAPPKCKKAKKKKSRSVASTAKCKKKK
jgi:CSLREA domain-containing protein